MTAPPRIPARVRQFAETSRPGAAVLLFLGVLAPRVVGAQGPPPASPVEIQLVRSERIVPGAVVLGTTEPKRRSVVAASIEGYVIEYGVDEGQRVKKGDVLARLRETILRLQLREARAALAQVREEHENARKDLERAQKLIETDAVTQKDLDDRATLERTLALRIPQAEVRVEILEADLAKKTVTAPFDGQVVREHTEVGEWVARGGPVATLVDISSVLVRVNVPERYVRFLSESASVRVEVPATGTRAHSGRVVSISEEGDPDSRTFPVRVELSREKQLRAGMSARVEIPAGAPSDALVIPKDAVMLQGVQSFVFVVGEGDRAERRIITTGPASGSRIAVLDGLAEGERVVVKGNERIQPGAPLRLVGGETSARD